MMEEKEYLVIVQCHLVMQRCSGYFCEKAFSERLGGFADYPSDKRYRTLYMTCGGCCGRALHRKLGFTHAGTIAQAGFKFGRWLDLAFLQKTLVTPLQPVDG